MLLRAIIIDDEQKGIDGLKILINRFINDLKIIAESTVASEAIDMIENYKPDIVFLDINMPEMNGFELLEKLNWKEFNLVFTTAHQEYALRALKNNAVDYLLKPIDHEDLTLAVSRIRDKIVSAQKGDVLYNYSQLLESMKNNGTQKIVVNLKDGVESIDLRDVIMFESLSNYTRIVLSDSRELMTSKTMKEYEAKVCNNGQPFMRVHHSYIINLRKVSRYVKATETIVMSNNKSVSLAKSRKEEFLNWLGI